MDFDIRKAILHNIKQNSPDELEATIVDAVSLGEEKVLPGLGFLFELIWKQSDKESRLLMIEALSRAVEEENL
jgi:small acid-soluble spore protein I (minor)